MSSPAHFQTLARYNRWMNERLYNVCATLDDAERRRDRGAFFRSIHGTLNHILLGDRLWLGRFTGEPFAVAGLDHELYADFAALRRGRAATDDAIEAYVDTLDDATLRRPLVFRSQVDPGDKCFATAFLLTHLFNHQTHHRGQVTTLLSQCGADPGVTDLLWLPGAALPVDAAPR